MTGRKALRIPTRRLVAPVAYQPHAQPEPANELGGHDRWLIARSGGAKGKPFGWVEVGQGDLDTQVDGLTLNRMRAPRHRTRAGSPTPWSVSEVAASTVTVTDHSIA